MDLYHHFKSGFLLLILTLATGCGAGGAFKALDDANRGKLGGICGVQNVEYKVDAQVVALEIENDLGLNMGFDILKNFLELFNVKFSSETGKMTLSLALKDPLKPDYHLASAIGSADMKSRDFRFDFDFEQIKTGFSYFFQTPLSELAERGLATGFDKLNEEAIQIEEKWQTHVISIPTESQIIVPVGSIAGLKAGDTFEVYNVEHVWSAQPCTSEHVMELKKTDSPIARGEIEQVQKHAALVNLTSVASGEEVEIGALVQIASLTGDGNRNLKRSLSIGKVTGGDITFKDGQVFNFDNHVAKLISTVAQQHGYYIYSPEEQ